MKRIIFLALLLLFVGMIIPTISAISINSTSAEGLIAYNELNVQTPRYRNWNFSSNNFSTEKTDTNSAGTDLTWVTVKASHERDEMIMVTEDVGLSIDAQIYNATGNWTSFQTLSNVIANDAFRAFDVAYEDISGDALVVYENSDLGSNNIIGYRIWNGSNFSLEINVSTTMATSPVRWIELTPKHGTDEMMVLIHTGAGDLSAVQWNGSDFDDATRINLSLATTSIAEQHFGFAWEGLSGDGLVIYGEGTTLTRRNYTSATKTWSAEELEDFANAVNGARICADPNSNYIGMILQDGGNDVNVRIWNGSRILVGSPTEDGTVEPRAANNVNVDCAWNTNGNTALFGFIDTAGLNMSFVTFTRTNESWSTTTLVTPQYTTNFASDDIGAIRFTEHPTTNETMIVALDILEDISAIRWNGTAMVAINASPTETSTEVLNGDQEGAMFDWVRFDAQPNVTGLTLNDTELDLNERVNFTVNITDNLIIDRVLANITLPNGSIQQATLTNVGRLYNLTFNETTLNGVYTIRVVANDTSTHNNINATETITFTAGDAIPPNVTNLAVNDSTLEVNERVNITARVVDNIAVNVVLINITIPGISGFDQYRMTNVGSTFNLTFTNTSRIGNYTVRIIANDTANNINATETITFAVGDITNPIVTQLQVNQTVLKVSETLNFTVNVTDNVLVDTVLVNVTVPNTTGFDQYRLTNITGGSLASIFNLTFTNTSRKGVYQIRVIANDTTNNRNITQTINFSVGDTINPGVVINSPADRFNSSSPSINFVFTLTDDSFSTIVCNLSVDGLLNNTNATAVNNTATTLIGTGFTEGNHNWNVTCADGDGNQNTTTMRVFTMDTSGPSFNTLTNDPNSADLLDTGNRIAFFANVTDNFTAVSLIRLQHKLINTTDFSNVTMILNSSNGLYEAGFTPTINGTYNVRIFATDIVGNENQSIVINITVENDKTWTRTPASVARGATASQTLTLVNVTLNNTGDFALNFTMMSTFADTRFNTTFPVQLSPNETRIVEVNVTAPSTTGATQFQIEINASPNANPQSQNISATLAVTEGQPFLAATFTDIPTSKTKGDTFAISAQIQNIGTGNATNGSVYFTIPSDWSLTGGDLNNTIGDLDVGSDAIERTITINIPSNATDGFRTVKVNASGLNTSNASLEPLGLLSGEERTVNVSNATIISAGPASVPAVIPAAPVSVSIPEAAPIPTSVGGVAGKLTPGLEKRLLETSELIYVVRGENTTFPLNITNIYNDTTLQEVEMEIDGYLAQYLSWQPQQIESVSFAEMEPFIVTIAAPSYKKREEHNLTVTVTGTIEQTVIDLIYNSESEQYDELKRIEKTTFVETRHVTLIILETSVLEAVEHQKQAENYLNEFREKGIGTARLEALVAVLNAAYAAEQFADVEQIAQEINAFAAMVLETYEILQELREKYESLSGQGYDVKEWNGLITIAEMAFAEENFESAYLRAKEAELYQAIAVEQQFNLGAFFQEYWQEIIIVLLIALSVGYYTERRIFLLTVDKLLARLDAREQQTELLKEEAQKECFMLKKISILTYHKRMYQYELLLDSNRKRRYELQMKREHLLTGEEILLFLRRDNVAVLDSLKGLQELYYTQFSISKNEYLQKSALYKNHLAQNEKEAAVIEAKLEAEAIEYRETREKIRVTLEQLQKHQLKKPPLQGITDMLSDISIYVALAGKHQLKKTFFIAKEEYDLLLLRLMKLQRGVRVNMQTRQKQVQDDLVIAQELVGMVTKEQSKTGNKIHSWNVREILGHIRYAITTRSITLSWYWKKKRSEQLQIWEKKCTSKEWSWKETYHYWCYRFYFLFEQWKWRCKELLLHVRT